MENEKELLRVIDVCRILGITRMTFYELIRNNLLEVIDINKGSSKKPRYRVKPSSLTSYIDKQTIHNSS
jgi:hypothetical protein